MLIIIISRSSLKLDHVGSKTRLLGHQATQVSDLGPLLGPLVVWETPVVRLSTLSNDFSSETTGPNVTKFHM